MFRKLQTKVTILYAALFALILVLVAQAVVPTVQANALAATKAELAAASTVFDRIWTMKSLELRDSADLLAQDFGFKAAVATGDQGTIDSALENLKVRRRIDHALLVMADGRIIGEGGRALKGGEGAILFRALNDNDHVSGVLDINGMAYETISAPVNTPQLIGWLVFATRLDRAQLRTLEQLSAIPLQATLVQQGPDRHWRNVDQRQASASPALDDFITNTGRAGVGAPRILATSGGKSIALFSPVASLGGGAPTVLLLQYPLNRAMAPYAPLLLSLAGLGLLCMVVMVGGSWALARSITRPIALLDDAVGQLGKGEHAEVVVASRDEIGRLAQNFNAMSVAISEREQRITEMALHDVETGLPNRSAVEARIQHLRQATEVNGLVVMAMSIDRIEVLRNAIGYPLVAAMVRELGARICAVRPDVLCARVSTGRLALVLPLDSIDAATEIAQRLLNDLSGPLTVGDTTVDVGLTIGLAPHFHSDIAIDAARLIEHANIAIDQAHGAHLKIAAFDANAYGDPARNLSLMSELNQAQTNGELSLYYQPKYDLRTGRIASMEALCRWRHATRGPIAPDLFIVMAEETGHIQPLTDWVLDRALADQQIIRAAGFDLPVAVNLSGQMAGDRAFAERAIAAIARSHGKITVEITETAVIANPDEALAVVDMMARAGIAVSIDDYGSGLSSLAYLKRIQAHELKIDKAFVLAIDQNSRDRLLVKSTIDLAHGLGMKVVAEGVETAEALALLAGMGCDYAQGYHIARPMPVTDLLAYLQQFEANAEAAPALRA